MNVGQRIQSVRKAKGFTQKQLGEIVGLATGTIQQYELGKREPNFENLQKIAEALGIKLGELMDYDGSIRVDTFKPTDDEMLKMNCSAIFSDMEKMNRAGQAVAVKTVKTLSEMPEYQKKNEPPKNE